MGVIVTYIDPLLTAPTIWTELPEGGDERYEAAKDLLLEAFKLRESQLDENSIHLIDTGLALGIAYQALEMPEEANLRLDAAVGSLEFGKFGLASIMDNLKLLASILR